MNLVLISQEFIMDGPEGPRGLGYLAADNLLSAELPYRKLLLARPDPRMNGQDPKQYDMAKPLFNGSNLDWLVFVPLPGVRGGKSLLAFKKAYQCMLRHIRPEDIVLLRNLGWMQILGYAAARRKKARIVIHLLGAYDKNLVTGSRFPWPYIHRAIKSLESLLLRKADAVAVVSPWLAQSYEMIPEEIKRFRVLPDTSLNENWLLPEPRKIASPLHLLYVGRLEPAKGVRTLLQAAKLLIDRDIPIKLQIVGTGSLQDEILSWIKRNDISACVQFSGYQSGDALKFFFDQAHILILPSRSEGLPIVALEGMARSKALIVSDIPAHRQLLNDGTEALFFPFDDVPALADAVQSLAENPGLYENVTANGFELSKTYLLNSIYPKWAALIEEVRGRENSC